MIPHERKDWRTCGNCVHKYVCKFRKEDKDPGSCVNHIYNADPKTYGDLQELIAPVCEWIRTHYPSDGKLTAEERELIELHWRYLCIACTRLNIYQRRCRKMISLYEMTNDFKTLFDSLDAIMENDDPELDSEEMTQAWFDTLEGMELEIEEKASNVAVYIKSTLAEAEALKAERDKLSARIKAKQNAAERMKQYLLDSMQKMSRNKIETSRAVISVRNNAESVNITDEGELIDWARWKHDEYLRYREPEINKAAVKKALQQGEDIPGCRLERTQSVTIK